MAIFSALGIATFLGIAADSFIAAAGAFVLNAAVGVAASLGLSYAAKALAGDQNQTAATAGNFGVQGTLQAGGAVPRSFNLGYSVTAGSLVYANYHGGDTATPNAYITQVISVADLPSRNITEFWVNNERVTLPDGGLVGGGQGPDAGYSVPEYVKARTDSGPTEPHLYIKYYDGTQTAADPYLVGTVSSDDRPYESTRVGVGVAYVVVTYLENDKLWSGFPEFKFAGAQVRLYDPSKDSSNGGAGSHRYSNPTTWGGDGDDLPAVQIYNLLRGFRYNGIWLYGLQNMSAVRLSSVNWLPQIAKCRATIQGESGSEPTYRSGGQINVNVQSANAIEAILTSCQGRLSEIGGFYKIHLGTPDSPTFSWTDDDILSSEEQVYRPFFALSDSVNGIQATYPDPAQGWNTVTAPAYYRPDLEVLDGNRRLMANPSFDLVPYPAQVQRLQKSAIEEAQRARTHTIVLPPVFWTVEPGDVGEWTSVRNGYSAKQFRADAIVDKANLDIIASLTEIDPSDYDWDHAVEFEPVTSGPTIIPRPAAQGVVDWFAEPWTLVDSDGVSRRPAIRLTWDGTQPGVAGIQYEVRLAVDQSDVTKGRTDQLAAGAIIVSQSLIPNTAYQVRGQYLPTSPRDMLWSDWLNVRTPDVLTSLVEFDAGLHERFTIAFDQLYELESRITQLISSTASINIARNWLDKKKVRTELSSVSEAISARITEESLVASSATSAVALRTTTLETAINDPTHGLSATATTADALYSQVNNSETGLSAIAGRTTTLEANANDSAHGLAATAGAVSQLQSQVELDSNHLSAMSLLLNSLNATVNDAAHGVIATANATDVLIAQVNLDEGHPSAISGRLSNFSTTLGDHNATLNLLASSVDGNRIMLGLVGTIDGVSGGLILTGVGQNGTVSFTLLYRGEFIVDGSILSSKIGAGEIKAVNVGAQEIDATHIKARTLTSDSGVFGVLGVKSISIGDNAVTVPKVHSPPGSLTGSAASQVAATVTLDVDTAGLAGKQIAILIGFSGALTYATNATYRGSITVSSLGGSEVTLINSAGSGQYEASLNFSASYVFTASGGIDTYIIRARVILSADVRMDSRTLWAVAAKR
ncbi:phage tail protein [uncultured Bradyrhizobium sp.]|uniref:phage tail protein n=1 Tax=uncultured Bradyrhizobium sp. TaxID=199684 RepID=UPI0035CBA772